MTKIEYRCSVRKDDSSTGDVLALDRIVPDSKEPQGVAISFQRTIRVPDNGKVSQLPPGLGSFPLFKVQEYASRLPERMARKGGVFFPMHQKEAMWISFHSTAPFMIKLYVGGVNVVSGEHSEEDAATRARRMQLKERGKTIQDYVVVPQQPWIDGIAVEPGTVRQFVAMPMGQGYSVEAQLTGKEAVGGLQFEITPAKHELENRHSLRLISARRAANTPGDSFIKIQTLAGKSFTISCNSNGTIDEIKCRIEDREGIPFDQQRLIYKDKVLEDGTLSDYDVQKGSLFHLLLGLRGGYLPPLRGHELGISAGGKIAQDIRKDDHDPEKWMKDLTFTIPVQILNSAAFRRVTGTEPPPCPIDAQAYANAGLPFFNLFEEEPSDVSGADAFAPIKSVNEIEQARGLAHGTEAMVHPRTVNLYHGSSLGSKIWSDGEVFHIDDPDGLLSSEGPLREVRTLADLEKEVGSLSLRSSGSKSES